MFAFFSVTYGQEKESIDTIDFVSFSNINHTKGKHLYIDDTATININEQVRINLKNNLSNYQLHEISEYQELLIPSLNQNTDIIKTILSKSEKKRKAMLDTLQPEKELLAVLEKYKINNYLFVLTLGKSNENKFLRESVSKIDFALAFWTNLFIMNKDSTVIFYYLIDRKNNRIKQCNITEGTFNNGDDNPYKLSIKKPFSLDK